MHAIAPKPMHPTTLMNPPSTMERNNATRDIKAKTPANDVSRSELANPSTFNKVLLTLDSILLCVKIFHYCYALDVDFVLP